jgi:hypothetical protein
MPHGRHRRAEPGPLPHRPQLCNASWTASGCPVLAWSCDAHRRRPHRSSRTEPRRNRRPQALSGKHGQGGSDGFLRSTLDTSPRSCPLTPVSVSALEQFHGPALRVVHFAHHAGHSPCDPRNRDHCSAPLLLTGRPLRPYPKDCRKVPGTESDESPSFCPAASLRPGSPGPERRHGQLRARSRAAVAGQPAGAVPSRLS